MHANYESADDVPVPRSILSVALSAFEVAHSTIVASEHGSGPISPMELGNSLLSVSLPPVLFPILRKNRALPDSARSVLSSIAKQSWVAAIAAGIVENSHAWSVRARVTRSGEARPEIAGKAVEPI